MYNQRVLLNPTGGGATSSSDGSYAVGDMLYASTVHVLSRLPIGSEGEVLTVTSGLPAWESSGAGDASPLTTKGDIYTYSTDNARLGVGTDGQVLTADSAETTGLKWATVAGTGTVVGPSGATTDNAVVRWDGTGGINVQNSGVTVDDSNNISAVGVNLSGLTASRVVVTDSSKNLASSSVTSTTLAFLDATSSVQTQLDAKQALDSDLTALAGLSSTGLIARTGSGTVSARTITGTTNQISVSNGDGVSGNPTLSTPQDIHTGASPTFAGTTLSGLTASTVLVANGSKAVTSSGVSTTTLGFLDATSSIQTQLDAKQALDADLTALAGLSSTGIIVRSGAGSATVRTITGTTNQVSVSNGDGVAGNPTLSLPQDIHTGASPTFAGETLSGLTASRVLVSDGSKAITSSSVTSTTLGFLDATSSIQTQLDAKQALDSDLTALAGLSSTGVVVRTGSGTATTRTITGTTNQISVSNGDGVAGNPTLSTPQDIHTAATPTFAGLTINNAGSLVLKELASSGTDSVSLRAPDNLGASYTLIMPADDGNSGEVLSTDGSGNLSWVVSSGGGGSGGGDVTGQASSVDSEIVLFSGTGGKTIKRATGTGVVHSTSGVYSVSNVSLTSEVTGVLPIANGGTNSSTTLNNNRVMQSTGGAVVEAAAITAARALISDANGIPTHSAVTSTTLAFLDATSSVQTQLDARVVGPGSATDNAITRFDGTTGKIVQNSAATIDDSGNLTAADGTLNHLTLLDGGSLFLRELAASGSSYVEMKAPDNLAGSYALTMPGDDGSAGQFLSTDGSGILSWVSAGGTGNVSGPVSSTDNAVVRWNGTGGNNIQNSGVIIDDNNFMSASGLVIDNQRITSQYRKNYIRNNSGSMGTSGYSVAGSTITLGVTTTDLAEDSVGTAIEVTNATTSDSLIIGPFPIDTTDFTRYVLKFAYNTLQGASSNYWAVDIEGDVSTSQPLAQVEGTQLNGTGYLTFYCQYITMSASDTQATITFTASSAGNDAVLRISSVFFGPVDEYFTTTNNALAAYNGTKGYLRDSFVTESSGSLSLGSIAGPGLTTITLHNAGSFDFTISPPTASTLGAVIELPDDDGKLTSFSGITPADNELVRWDSTVGRVKNSGVTIDASVNMTGTNNITTNTITISTGASAGKFLKSDAVGLGSWDVVGDVVGPASATNNNVALFDGVTGKLLKDSGLAVPAAFGDVVGPSSAVGNNIALFDGTSGKLIKDSAVAMADVVIGPASSTSGNLATFNGTSGKLISDSGVLATSVVAGPAAATADAIVLYDGTSGKLIKDSAASLGNLVVGPASATNNAPAIFDGTTGKLLKDGPTPAADGTYSPVTSITIVNGIITAIS